GDISLPKLARIGSVDQEHPATPVSLLDTVLAADAERERLNAALETAAPEQMGEIYARLIEIDADGAPPVQAKSSTGSASQPPTWRGRWPSSPAAGACGLRSRPPCSRARICCCSTSRPTTSISKARCGSRRG